MIERHPFGRTGHDSTRIIFGAAALGGMSQERADRTLELIDDFGINHIDTAAGYGDSELRLAPLLKHRRGDYFLATKTRERTRESAREGLHRSLERMGVDHVDLIQMHNLVAPDEWDMALGPGGALEALVEAREEGLVSFIGVTGHGTYVAERHLQSLARFSFDSVLVPFNFSMMANPQYRFDFEKLYEHCRLHGVGFQTIKAIARRRWREEDDGRRFSWYMPLSGDPLRRAVHWVLSRPGVFLNTTSDATLLPAVLEAAREKFEMPSDTAMAQDQIDAGIEPLFVRDVSDDVRVAAD